VNKKLLSKLVVLILLSGAVVLAYNLLLPVSGLEEQNETGSAVLTLPEPEASNPADEISNIGRGPSDEEKEDWQALEDPQGPPPWAASRAKDTEGWLDGDREGPPPWAGRDHEKSDQGQGKGPSDEEKEAWQALEDPQGPPPWAASRAKDTEGWLDGDREGPPPWAGAKDDTIDGDYQ
jgi:hypothetical protein